MIVDVHAYWDEKNMTIPELRAALLKHGISHVILSPPCTQGFEPDKSALMYGFQRFLLRNNLLRPLAALISRSFYNRENKLRPFWKLFTRHQKPINKVEFPDNENLLKAIAAFDEMSAWCWLNPKQLPKEESLISLLQHPKTVGIKIHGYWHRFGKEEAKTVFALALRYQCPLYFILGFGWIRPLQELLEEFPSVQVIIGYGGFPYFDLLWKEIRFYPNVMIDLTSFHIDCKGIRDAILALGANRCLYGSDCPYNFKDQENRFDYGNTLERIRQQKIERKSQEAILGGNAAVLLGISS